MTGEFNRWVRGFSLGIVLVAACDRGDCDSERCAVDDAVCLEIPDRDACETKRGCAPELVDRLDRPGACVEAGVYAGCRTTLLLMQDTETPALGPDGRCWLFGSWTYHPDFQPFDDACGYADFEGVPTCG